MRNDRPSVKKMSFDGAPLTNGSFFRNPKIVELDLAGQNLPYMPLSVSQCALLSRVNLTGTLFSRPPIILFSIPWLRQHPERITFGTGQSCSRDLMQRILNSAADYGQCETSFIDPSGDERFISLSPEISSRDFACLIAGPLAIFIDDLFIVRSVSLHGKLHILRISPGDEPMVLYFYPECTFSLEFKFIPTEFANVPEAIPLFTKYAEEFKDDPDVSKALKLVEDNAAADVDVPSVRKFVERSFSGRTVTGFRLGFIVAKTGVTIFEGETKIEVGSADVHFDRQNGKLWLYVGQHRYEIDELDPGSVTEMPAYVQLPFQLERKPKEHDFCAIAGRAIDDSMVELVSSTAETVTLDPDNIEEDLESRKKFRGRAFNFMRQEV